MCVFTCIIFTQYKKVYAQSLLGLTAVISVLLSIGSAYGVMFMIGVPFTSMTHLLPFILFGVGLDDSFVIMGSFVRTNEEKDVVERIRETMDEVGISITITSVTSVLAFILGCTTSIPAIYWLCLYAFPSVITIYLYQITFFVACIVLEEERIRERRGNCCNCFVTTTGTADPATQYDESIMMDKFMYAYAHFLLTPWMKLFVLISFATLAITSALSASKLEQAFSLTDVLPKDSYLTDFIEARSAYTDRSLVRVGVYFRDVDQSDPLVQDQMFKFVADLVEMDAILAEPEFFWLRTLKTFVNLTRTNNLDFDAQVHLFLGNPIVNRVFGRDIVLDENMNIAASRCFIDMDKSVMQSVTDNIKTLEAERQVVKSQLMNQGKKDFPFFTYTDQYRMWEFYAASVGELTFTAVTGVVSVTVIALLMIPHWSAAFIVLPIMCVLYVDMLGFMQWCGVTINGVSYMTLSLSIGLMVDFIVHVLLRYYEAPGSNRQEKALETIRTMGSSVFMCGISTLLGTVPLAFSTSNIFRTVFIAFVGLVLLGMTHGLILLPVVLSLIGTEETISTNVSTTVQDNEKQAGMLTTMSANDGTQDTVITEALTSNSKEREKGSVCASCSPSTVSEALDDMILGSTLEI